MSGLIPIGVASGSFDWLVLEFKKHQKWKDIGPHTQRTYENGTKLFADHLLKDGTQVGSKQVQDFTAAFVDAVWQSCLWSKASMLTGIWCVVNAAAWLSRRWSPAGELGS